MVIELKELTTGYVTSKGVVKIQEKMSDTLKSGEYTCLLGPNGAGKSTLLRTLSCLLPKISGEVLLNGVDMTDMSPAEISRSIGIVLTERPSVSSMTVEQLVALGRSPYTGFWGRLTDRDRRAVEEAMHLTRTCELRDRLVDTLSDGECQRVMIAKALAQQTPAIFLDEPTAFLDYPGKAEMMLLLRRLAHDKDIMVFQSTHDLNMALALADRIWLVDKRMGVRIGTPRDLADAGDLSEFFLRPGITFDSETLEFHVEAGER